ncbi:MAG: hypothetical protein ACTHLE_11720 [Agriterribacter sp.]
MVSQSSNQNKYGKQTAFSYLENGIDTSMLHYVATYMATLENKKADITSSFFAIKKMANQLGANCFSLKSFANDSTGIGSFTLDVFYADEITLTNNSNKHTKNIAYVFCSQNKDGKIYSLKVDNKKTEFTSGSYLTYELKEGTELKLSKGGFTGATVWLKYQPDRFATFFTITGFGLGGSIPPPGTIGMSFNTGRINYIDRDLGFLLTRLLEKAN